MSKNYNLIEVKDVAKKYDGHIALDGVSLNVPKGSVYGLLGPNGAGKSTLIRILNHIIAPDSGQVLLDGHPSSPADVQLIGYLPEERGLYKKMKVADHIIYIGRLKGMSRADAATETDMWLRRFNLLQWKNKKVEALSKGMAQKVQFIATVIHRPQLLIFDEPFSGFDPINTEQLKSEILRLKDEGATVLFSTHNMDSVEEVCQQISLINNAKVILAGDVEQIRRSYSKHTYSVELLDNAPLQPADNLYTIIENHPSRAGFSAQIRLNPSVEIRSAINFINEHHLLCGFSEQLPKMNDIFIDAVSHNTKNTSE